jgi:hypothetical protein
VDAGAVVEDGEWVDRLPVAIEAGLKKLPSVEGY